MEASITASEAARLLGSVQSERKAAAARESGKKHSERHLSPLACLPCSCGGEGVDHSSTCPRDRSIRRRVKMGRSLQ